MDNTSIESGNIGSKPKIVINTQNVENTGSAGLSTEPSRHNVSFSLAEGNISAQYSNNSLSVGFKLDFNTLERLLK